MTQIGWLYNEEMNTWAPGEITAASGGLPAGGTTGQVLTKESDADGDAGWENGGSQPVKQTQYFSNAFSVDPDSTTKINWNDGEPPYPDQPQLLDITDPTEPIFTEDGTYALTVTLVGQEAAGKGAYFYMQINDDDDDGGGWVSGIMPLDGVSVGGTHQAPQTSAPLTWATTEGQSCYFQVYHNADTALNFGLEVMIVKIG